MLWNNSSLSNLVRGKSVGGNMYNNAGKRSMNPRFLKEVGKQDEKLGKQRIETRKIVMKKQNIRPQLSYYPKSREQTLQLDSHFDRFPQENLQPQSSHYSKHTLKIDYHVDEISQDTLKQNVRQSQVDELKICHPRGLHNIGNTCYMNSTLQCLFHLSVFNSKLLRQCTDNSSVAAEYVAIVQQLINCKRGTPINPAQFKRSVGRRKTRFLGSAQQDAQQFLTSFLEIVNEELSRVKGKVKYRELQNDPEKATISSLSEEWWQYNLSRDNSVICDVFQGQVISIVRCNKCSKKSVTFDNFWEIPVTIHKAKSVFELLAHHWQNENLIDGYHCSRCRKTRMCSKFINLYRAPKVLAVQLKRFEYGRFAKQKKNDNIKIDGEINLKEFFNKDAIESSRTATSYKLRGVIHHFGEVDFGHYTADILNRHDNRWYEMNDSRYSETSCPTVSRTAYLLFYELIQ